MFQIWLLIVTVGVTVTIDHWWAWWLVLIPITVGLTPLLAGLVSYIIMNCKQLKPVITIINLQTDFLKKYLLRPIF